MDYELYTTNPNRPAKRNEFAEMFANAFPDVNLYPINRVSNNSIPDVKNMTVEEAQSKIQELGLTIETDKYEESTEIEADRVTRTSPQIGRRVKKGSSITLYISSGEGGIILDDYTGQNYLEVKGALESKNISVKIKKEEPQDYNKVSAEDVLRQEPAKGTLVKAGEQVTLYVPDMNTTYPDFTEASWTLAKIQEWCDKYSVTFANVDSSIVSAFVYLRIDFTTSFNFMSFPSIFFCINHTFIDALSADFFFILYIHNKYLYIVIDR